MQILSAQIRGFRNLQHIDVAFEPGVNVIFGANAQGKTNLLEALNMLVTGRSFRDADNGELLPWDGATAGELSMVRADVQRLCGPDKYVLTFNARNKFILINGAPIDRLGEMVGRFNCVLFTPTDLALVTGQPGGRRRYINQLFSQIDTQYFTHLQLYSRALNQHNAMLKIVRNAPAKTAELAPWAQQIAHHGGHLVALRQRYIAPLAEAAAQAYAQLAGNGDSAEILSLIYAPNTAAPANAQPEEITEILLRALRERTELDIMRGSTSVGPHRDDMVLNLHQHSARDYASQGQQRSIVIALKQAELAMLTEHSGEPPVLMLDDLLSELDQHRRRALIENLPTGIQTFITTTDANLIATLPQVQQTLRMTKGRVKSEE